MSPFQGRVDFAAEPEPPSARSGEKVDKHSLSCLVLAEISENILNGFRTLREPWATRLKTLKKEDSGTAAESGEKDGKSFPASRG